MNSTAKDSMSTHTNDTFMIGGNSSFEDMFNGADLPKFAMDYLHIKVIFCALYGLVFLACFLGKLFCALYGLIFVACFLAKSFCALYGLVLGYSVPCMG